MRILISLMTCMVFSLTSCGQTQNHSKKMEAEEMLRSFYTDYITAFTTQQPGTSSQKKLEMLQKQYCTEALLKKIPGIIEQTDSDPFLKAQDSDIRYLKTLAVAKKMQKKDEYIVSYIADATPDEKIIITVHVTVVKEGNNYKISSVR